MLLVQVDKFGIPTTDMGYNIIEACKWHKWYRGSAQYGLGISTSSIAEKATMTIIDPPNDYIKYDKIIPVGTIEFVEEHLKRYHGKDHINVINIPKELSDKEDIFVKRKIWKATADQIIDSLSKNPEERIFVKSATVNKKFTNIIDKYNILKIPEDTYYISRCIEFLYEWRAFVYNGEVVGVQQYSGEWGVSADIGFIKSAVNVYKNCPPAYTLDIGVMSNGQVAVVEVHNLISCGLYGFDNYAILPNMVTKAYNYECK